MRCSLLLALLALTAAPALAEITVTTEGGATAIISRDCTRNAGQAVCSTESFLTGPEGKTASKTRVRTAERGLFSSSITLTGPEGKTRTRLRSFSRGN
jgi:hypothetical protein